MFRFKNTTLNIMENTHYINNPEYYGGSDNPYEAIKIIEAWSLNFCLGNALKYIVRAGKKDAKKRNEDLKKAIWYLNREIHKKVNKDGKCCKNRSCDYKYFSISYDPFFVNKNLEIDELLKYALTGIYFYSMYANKENIIEAINYIQDSI